ncbi:MAG: hypothetical protein ABI351_13845, partial [Herbaspirillum sp.]
GELGHHRGGEAWDLLFKPAIAHRGLWSPDGAPENSLAAFQIIICRSSEFLERPEFGASWMAFKAGSCTTETNESAHA